MNNYHYLFKFIVIGDTGVGKSCVVLQFIENKTRTSHDVTIGVEFGAKTIPVKNKNIKLQIWDTAGQENFRSITRCFVGVRYYEKRYIFAYGNPHMQILLVGNKNDLQSERSVSYKQGQNLAQENGLNFIQINAKDYHKVEQAFRKVAESILEKIEEGSIPLNQGIGIKTGQQDANKSSLSDYKKESKKNSQCC